MGRENLDGKLLSRGLLHLLYDKLEETYSSEWHRAVAGNVLDLGGYGNVSLSLAERYKSDNLLLVTDKRYTNISKWMTVEQLALNDVVPEMNRRRSYRDYKRRGFAKLLPKGELFAQNHPRYNVVFINYDYGDFKPERAFWFARHIVQKQHNSMVDGFIIMSCNLQWLNTRGRWLRMFSQPDTCPEWVIMASETWEYTTHPCFYVWRAMGENPNPKLDFILRHEVTPLQMELAHDSDVKNEFYESRPNPRLWKGWDYKENKRKA